MSVARPGRHLGAIGARGAFPLALTLAGLLSLGACNVGGGGEDKLEEGLIRDVEQGSLVDEVVESGRIAPVYEVDIKARVSGEVLEVLVDEGDYVEKDQLLLKLEGTDYSRQVRLAQVGMEEALLNQRNSESELARSQEALDARGISKFEFDRAERTFELAKVAVKRAQVNLDSARDQLRYTEVKAPMSGTIIRRNVDPGELITAGLSATVNGESALTIARVDTLVMELDLNQVDVARVKVGQASRVLLDAYPGEEVEGKVTQIAAAGRRDASKGIDVFDVRVEMDPSTAKVDIKPGMTAEVRILVGEYPDVVKVPLETVFEDEGKSYVLLVTEDPEKEGAYKKERVEVEIGNKGSRELEITSGLKGGDRIYAKVDSKSKTKEGPERGRR